MSLSLENSASGTHLTAANHVVLVHPMAALTRAAEIVMEQQAIGRVRRIGQQKKVVVWRLVADGTIEADIVARKVREPEVMSARQAQSPMLPRSCLRTSRASAGVGGALRDCV